MDKLEALKKKIEEFQAKSSAKEEIKAFITLVLSILKKAKDNFDSLTAENLQTIKESIAYIESINEKAINSIDDKTNTMVGQFDAKLALLKDLLTKVESIKATPGKDGLDGLNGINPNPEDVVPFVLELLPKPIEETGEKIVDKINSLETDDDDLKIDASHIKNLPKITNNTGGGVRFLQYLQDTNIQNPTDGQVLTYDSTDRLWKNEAGGDGHTIEDEGTPLTQRTSLNFVGAGVSVADSGGKTVVTINGGGTVDGSGVANELTYWVDSDTLGSLSTVTYPSLIELSYVKGVTSSIQSQLNGKSATGHTHTKTDLTDIADFLLESEVDADIKTLSLPASTTISTYAKSFLDDADEATFKATVNLEVGVDVQAYDADLTTWAGLTPSANAQSLVTAANYAAMRTLLDLEAGTDFYSIAAADLAFQPLDTQLTSLAGLSYTGNALKVIRVNAGENAFELATISGGGLSDGDYGDITVGGTGTTMTIDNGVVSLGKMADVATGTVFYRKTAGTGSPEVQTLATLKTDLGLTGTNSGDQTTIVGITGTKAQFDTAVTDGNFLYVGDITQYTDELAQDAVGNIFVDSSEIDFTYNDGVPSITASLIAGSIDETKLDASVNASLDLADSALQSSAIGVSIQAYDADLTDLATKWTTASASGAASLQFHEDTDNGVHKATLIGAASLAGDIILTLPTSTGTIALTSDIPSLTGYVNTTGTPANNQLAIFTDADTIEGDSSLTYDGTNLNLATGKNFQIAGITILADAAGTTTLSGIDALDATTEATIEGAIDTLVNLTSIQGRTVTLVDAGANAIFGWDDVAGAYENLSQAEARAVLGLGTAAYVATDLADLNEATIEAAIDTLANLTSIQSRTITLADAGADSLFGWDDSASAYQNLSATDSRIALGLATTDSPMFTGIELGHASDTTITRVSAGVVAVEGVNLVKAGAVTSNGITMATARLLGRTTASTGAIEEISVGAGLTLSGGSLSASGGSATATTKSITQVAHGLAVNDVIKFSGTTYSKAQADSAANAEWVGVVTTVTDADNFTFTMEGYATLSTLTSDTVYFLSASTAGLLTATEPSTAGQVSCPILKTTSTTTGIINRQRGVLVPSATTITPNVKFSTMFEASGRWSTNHTSGTATFGTSGVSLDTTATGSRAAQIYMSATVPGASQAPFDGSPSFSCSGYFQTIGTTGYSACGVGDTSGGTATTTRHISFFIETSGGTTNLYASNANGTTQTKSASLTTLSATDLLDLYWKKTSTTSISFYWRKNGSAWSSATTHTTNLPSGTSGDYLDFRVANTTGQFVTIFQTANYER